MSGPAGVGIGEWLTLSAAEHPDTACFVHADGSELSFGAVNERVNRLADGLTAAGVQRGDRIAVLTVNSHRYAEVVLAAMKLGAAHLPLDNRLQAPEVATLTGRGRPAALFHRGRYAGLVEGLEVTTVVDLDSGYEPLLATGRAAEPPALLERELRLWG